MDESFKTVRDKVLDCNLHNGQHTCREVGAGRLDRTAGGEDAWPEQQDTWKHRVKSVSHLATQNTFTCVARVRTLPSNSAFWNHYYVLASLL